MGYRVLGRREDVYKGYEQRPGLDGPFVFAGGRILYYDAGEGAYWDPTTDFFVSEDEMDQLRADLMRLLNR